MGRNIIEKAIVPYNPSTNTVINHERYNLFVPMAGRGKAGIASFKTEDFDVSNGEVSSRTKAFTPELKFSLSEDGTHYICDGLDTENYSNARLRNILCVLIPSVYNGKPVNRIEDRAFAENDFLVSVIISDGISEIGISAFNNCSELISLYIPDTVMSMGTACIKDCNKLFHLRLPNNIKLIPTQFLQNCMSLTEVRFPDSVTEINDYVLSSISRGSYPMRLRNVYVPGRVAAVGKRFCALCENLEKVVFEQNKFSVGTRFGEEIFYLSKIKRLIIPWDTRPSAFGGTIESIDYGIRHLFAGLNSSPESDRRHQVYGIDMNNTPVKYNLDGFYENFSTGSIVQRREFGTIGTPEPRGDIDEAYGDEDAVNKKYFRHHLYEVFNRAIKKDSNVDGSPQRIEGDLRIVGNLIVDGKNTIIESESIMVGNRYIVCNSNGVDNTSSGIAMITGPEVYSDGILRYYPAYGIIYDEVTDTVQIGRGVVTQLVEYGYESPEPGFMFGYFDELTWGFVWEYGQPISTRPKSMADENIPVWDAERNTFVDSGNKMSDLVRRYGGKEQDITGTLITDSILNRNPFIVCSYDNISPRQGLFIASGHTSKVEDHQAYMTEGVGIVYDRKTRTVRLGESLLYMKGEGDGATLEPDHVDFGTWVTDPLDGYQDQALATRADNIADGHIPVWDGDKFTFVDSGATMSNNADASSVVRRDGSGSTRFSSKRGNNEYVVNIELTNEAQSFNYVDYFTTTTRSYPYKEAQFAAKGWRTGNVQGIITDVPKDANHNWYQKVVNGTDHSQTLIIEKGLTFGDSSYDSVNECVTRFTNNVTSVSAGAVDSENPKYLNLILTIAPRCSVYIQCRNRDTHDGYSQISIT